MTIIFNIIPDRRTYPLQAPRATLLQTTQPLQSSYHLRPRYQKIYTTAPLHYINL